MFRIAAIGAGAVFAVVLAEVSLRALDLASADGVATVTEGQFAAIPGILAPNQHVRDRRIPALPHTITTDSLGYRGAPFPRRKAPDEVRILFVGDSFVFGDFVDDGEALPSVLEAELGGRCQAAVPRVINAGLGGSTITEHYEILQRSLPLEPDHVIVLFSENDVQGLAGVSMWSSLAENREAKSRFPLSVVYPVARNTALWNLMLQVRGRLASERTERIAPGEATAGAAQARTLELRERYAQELRRLSSLVAERQIPLSFVVYPSHLTLTGAWPRDQVAWALATARSVGLPAFDLSPALGAAETHPESLYLLPHDGHPSPEGYARVATFLADQLMTLPELSADCSTTEARSGPGDVATPPLSESGG